MHPVEAVLMCSMIITLSNATFSNNVPLSMDEKKYSHAKELFAPEELIISMFMTEA